ncbi:hypothetical protein EDB80DRAFT_807583 [Ilyonectria destructans]|nr:hypothetical protein EDB80DRAFT_807583 [Ilyonectria destructans]
MAMIKMRWSEADGKVVDMTGAIRYFRSRKAMEVCTGTNRQLSFALLSRMLTATGGMGTPWTNVTTVELARGGWPENWDAWCKLKSVEPRDGSGLALPLDWYGSGLHLKRHRRAQGSGMAANQGGGRRKKGLSGCWGVGLVVRVPSSPVESQSVLEQRVTRGLHFEAECPACPPPRFSHLATGTAAAPATGAPAPPQLQTHPADQPTSQPTSQPTNQHQINHPSAGCHGPESAPVHFFLFGFICSLSFSKPFPDQAQAPASALTLHRAAPLHCSSRAATTLHLRHPQPPGLANWPQSTRPSTSATGPTGADPANNVTTRYNLHPFRISPVGSH